MNLERERLKRLISKVTRRGRVVIERSDLVPAAVLVPIVFRNDTPHLIMTKRTMTVATHKGQVSFPGGAREPTDRDAVDNALRESREEIGLDPELAEVVGVLDDFTTITNFIVTPVVAFISEEAKFRLNTVEVDELFEVPMKDFLSSQNHDYVTLEHENKTFRYHEYQIDGHTIWGATAGIIHRFLSALAGEEAA